MYVLDTSEDELDFDFRGRRSDDIDESNSVCDWVRIDIGRIRWFLHGYGRHGGSEVGVE